MSVQSYLDTKASSAILSDEEKSSIATSISTLSTRLAAHFDGDISERFQFGSSTRGTILPRSMDEHSDIDYMIVFKDEDVKPQTHIDRLKRFAEKYYSSSDIAQSSPTIVLKLNHIRFDLVPAIKSYLQEYRIPATSTFQDWMATSPNDFNAKLSTANVNASYRLKPAIRLLKYWNATSGYIYETYGLEQWVVAQFFYNCSTIRDYLFRCVEILDLDWSAAQWKKDKVARAKAIVANVKDYEERGMPASAEQEVKRLIP